MESNEEKRKLDWKEILEEGKKFGLDEKAVLDLGRKLLLVNSFEKMLTSLFIEHSKHVSEVVLEISAGCGNLDEQAEAKFAEIIKNAVIEYSVSVLASFAANNGVDEGFISTCIAPRFIAKLKGCDENDVKIGAVHRYVNGKPSGGVNGEE